MKNRAELEKSYKELQERHRENPPRPTLGCFQFFFGLLLVCVAVGSLAFAFNRHLVAAHGRARTSTTWVDGTSSPVTPVGPDERKAAAGVRNRLLFISVICGVTGMILVTLGKSRPKVYLDET